MPFTKQSLGKNIFNHWMTISVTLFLRVSMDGWLLTDPIVQLKAGSTQISFFLYQAFLAIPLHHKPQVSAVFPPISSFCSLLLVALGEHISVPKIPATVEAPVEGIIATFDKSLNLVPPLLCL